MSRKPVVALACLLAVAGCGPEGTAATGAGTTVPSEGGFDVTDTVSLQSTWWTWASSAPEGKDPVGDTTGARCGNGQQAGVWLLAGSFGETVTRRCTVPAEVPLAGPAVNFMTPTRAACDEYMREATGEVSLDGVALPLHEASPAPITFRRVPDNPVTGEGGEFEGYACGLWFSHPGLGPGEYVLAIDGASGGFSTSVTYELTVERATSLE
jgi:hypothetical protein